MNKLSRAALSLCAAPFIAIAACDRSTPVQLENRSPSPALAPGQSTTAGGYESIDLGTLGGTWLQPIALDDDSRVVGWSGNARNFPYAFLWDNGAIHQLAPGAPGSAYSANDLNKRGQIVGFEVGDAAVLLWDGVDAQPQRFIARSDGERMERGRIVGISKDADFLAVIGDGARAEQTVLWQGGVRQDIGGLSVTSPPGTGAMAWDEDEVRIVGRSFVYNRGNFNDRPQFHPFVWQNAVMTDLSLL